MWFKRIFGKDKSKKLIEDNLEDHKPKISKKRNLFCIKCNFPVKDVLYCDKCQEYIDDMENKKMESIKAKEELQRRSWIKSRDEFLNKKDDSR